jgi:NAD(P)-dependent dehydrogenase (short-subunit alcohol dehydrogenase family)
MRLSATGKKSVFQQQMGCHMYLLLIPWRLTSLPCLITKPNRLIYTSSGVHRSGNTTLTDLTWENRVWSGYSAYADSKLHNAILAFAVARKWPEVLSNAVVPGWVATKMGGAGAPDSLKEAPETPVWPATGIDKQALVSGKYFYHKKLRDYRPEASDVNLQERFLSACSRLSGIEFPIVYNS